MKKLISSAIASLIAGQVIAAPLPGCEDQGLISGIGDLIIKSNNLAKTTELRVSNIGTEGQVNKVGKKKVEEMVNCRATIEVVDGVQKQVTDKLDIAYGVKRQLDGQFQLFFNPIRN